MLKSFKSRTDQAEERICKFKDGSLKLSSQSSENIKENEEKNSELWNANTKYMHCRKQIRYKTSRKQKSPKGHHKQLNTNKMNKQGEIDIFLLMCTYNLLTHRVIENLG